MADQLACTCRHSLTDRDLIPANRVSANFWKLKYFEAMVELRNANKGIRRLRAGRSRPATTQPAAETTNDKADVPAGAR